MTQAAVHETAAPAAIAAQASNEYLTFTLGREEYGIEILKVQEIRRYEAVTHIANAPEFSSTFDIDYITGSGTVEDPMLILVDIEKLMTGSAMAH